jgi:pimeloyl-ACP methyl ester carboxylesterase
MHNKRPTKWLILLGSFLLVAAGLWGLRWATYSRPPLPEAVQALESDDQVTVSDQPWLTFTPRQPPDSGFIFYPGGRIDPRGYAPLLKEVAAAGYLVVVPEMPINMAPFDPNVADDIIAAYPEIRRWAIGGHSVGGTMAAQYTNTHREAIAGLAIWASYPASNADLSDANLAVVLIYGTLDPTVNDESVNERRHLLPANTHYVRIDGGDHHQFGSYEIRPEEHHATIDRAAQQEQIVEQTLDLLQSL